MHHFHLAASFLVDIVLINALDAPLSWSIPKWYSAVVLIKMQSESLNSATLVLRGLVERVELMNSLAFMGEF